MFVSRRALWGIICLGTWFALLPPAPAAVDYLADVKPIFTRHCASCHGEDRQKGGLRLDTAEAARKGGGAGSAVRPGQPADSLVVQVLEGTHDDIARMPYKKPPLAPEEIARIREWIAGGAPAPAAETPGRYVHWSVVAPQHPTPPRVGNRGTVRNPIDAFIVARLERERIQPSPEADRITLLRRLHLDLTGLPPSPSEVESFMADPRSDAYEQRVEQLLDSPHHGERWARWWLDVARYSDSNGYSIDAPRSIWPWRDWVVAAFNADMPFDRFTIEQLAGDLVPGATLNQRIATGFHRNTQINQEGGIDPEQFRIESVLDRVNTTGTAFLGLTVGCAQCHDHKFDPISQREYFQLFAFFNNQDEPTLTIPSAETDAAVAVHEEKTRRLQSALAHLPEARDADPAAAQERKRLDSELAQLRKSKPVADTSLALSERPQPRDSHVFIKGDFTRLGDPVTPSTPSVLHPFHPHSEKAGSLPTRLDLAEWLVDPANPLMARVTVNRIWQQYFGAGLVETENDFGTQGIEPVNPALLDWLATEFIARGWSLKAVHRLIVTSATYRQSSNARPDLAEKDATNRLLARQNRLRLDAEIVRDVALAASGRFNPEIGGPGVFPPQPDGVMNLGQSRREWNASEGPERFRRGLYTFHWRATPHPALSVFDAPGGFSACTRRPRSNTPLQALTLLNDAAFVELANALADRVTREAAPPNRLDLAFRLCVARPPKAAEIARLEPLLDEERRDHGESAAWQTLARVLLNLDEAITRE